MKTAIIGDGGWGTALALVLDRNGHPVTVWGAFPEYLAEVEKTRENRKFLPGFPIPDKIEQLFLFCKVGCEFKSRRFATAQYQHAGNLCMAAKDALSDLPCPEPYVYTAPAGYLGFGNSFEYPHTVRSPMSAIGRASLHRAFVRRRELGC